MRVSSKAKVIEEQAQKFNALSNPIRLYICHQLYQNGPQNVSFFDDESIASKSNIGQSLIKLRTIKILDSYKDKTVVYYKLVDEDIKKYLDAAFETLSSNN